jgi:hypothetical protein
MAENNICTPSAAKLLACDSVDALKELDAPARLTRDNKGEHSFICSSNAFMAPWQTKTILEANSKDPYQLILVLNQAAKAFDSSNAEEEGFQSALAHSGFLLRWLWAAAQGSISRVNLFFGLDNPELQEFSAQRHKECILPAITANGIVGQREVPRLLQEIERSNDLEISKRNRMDKWIKHHVRLLILNSLSEDGETAVSDPTDELKEVLNSESVGQAGKTMLWQFNKEGYKNTRISEQVLGTNPNTIRGLSAFNLSDSGTGNSIQADEFTMLHLADTQGKPKSLDGIKSFHGKNNIIVPSTYTKMIDSAEQMAVGIKLYQGPNSKPFLAYSKYVRTLKDNKAQIIAMGERDSQGFAKCLLAQELYLQQFNNECSTCEAREDVNEKYLDFSGISFGISVQRIDVDSPICFSRISQAQAECPPPPSDPNQDNKSRHKDKKRKIENTDQ